MLLHRNTGVTSCRDAPCERECARVRVTRKRTTRRLWEFSIRVVFWESKKTAEGADLLARLKVKMPIGKWETHF